MSDILEDDDNMVLLVVGDEKNIKDDQQIKVPCPITIKIEPIDGYTENKSGCEIFKTEEKENKVEYEVEFLEDNNIKHEHEHIDETEEYDIEYLEDFPLEEEMNSQSEMYEEKDNDDDDDDEDYSEQEKKKKLKMTLRKRTPKRRRTQKVKKRKAVSTHMPLRKTPRNYVSFVKQLRKENPEMAKNGQLLIEHLAGIMREITPPTPPENYHEVIEVDEGVKIYKCQFCNVQRNTLPSSARHYQLKHGEFYLTCFACGNTYRNTPSLYKHEKRCIAPDAKIVLQARGFYLGRKGRGRPFTTTHRFITAHTPADMKKLDTRLFCSKCPASFVLRENLVAHENSHEGLRPYRCKQCDVSYTSYQSLRRHVKLHGESQYMCDHCGRGFKLRPALISHLDSHRPLRKHGCLCCSRRFTQKTALRHHMNKVHLNLPAAHGCPVCPKRYARLSHVKEHMNRVHGLTLITRKMYARAVPSMTDAHLNQIFGRDVDQIIKSYDVNEPEHILPDLQEPPKETFIKIIKKVKVDTEFNAQPNETESDLSPSTSLVETKVSDVTKNTANTKIKRESKIDATPKKEQPEKPKPKKRKKPQPRKVVVIEPPVQVDEEIDDEDVYNIEYKRKRKSVNTIPEKKKSDDDMYKIVRDIKSTLTNQKKVANDKASKRKSTQNFYELKREFMDQLKNEIETPEPKDEKPEYLLTENESQAKEGSGEDASDDDEWKGYKDAHEKNQVIANFLEYMETGLVPKHVPILRRGKQTNKKQ